MEYCSYNAGNTTHKPPLGMNETEQMEGGVEDTIVQGKAITIQKYSSKYCNAYYNLIHVFHWTINLDKCGALSWSRFNENLILPFFYLGLYASLALLVSVVL